MGDLHEELQEVIKGIMQSGKLLRSDIWKFEQETFGPGYDPFFDDPVGYYRVKNRVVAKLYNQERKVPKILSRQLLLRALKIARRRNRQKR